MKTFVFMCGDRPEMFLRRETYEAARISFDVDHDLRTCLNCFITEVPDGDEISREINWISSRDTRSIKPG